MTLDRLERTRSALFFLKQARALLAPDHAPQTLARVRSAIKSAEGAVRHAQGLETRTQHDSAMLKLAERFEAQDAAETRAQDLRDLQARNATNPALAALRRACSAGEPIVEVPTPEALAARAEYADLRNARDAEGDPLDGDNLDDAVTVRPRCAGCGEYWPCSDSRRTDIRPSLRAMHYVDTGRK